MWIWALLQGVASRDIKLENTLLDTSPRPLVKICDFGYSKHEKFQSAPGSRVGTPAYLAPEVIMTAKGQTYDGKVRMLQADGLFIKPGGKICAIPGGKSSRFVGNSITHAASFPCREIL